jgi:hypothetical protein
VHPPRPIAVWRLPHQEIEIQPWGACIRFADGSWCNATPPVHDPGYAERVLKLGYTGPEEYVRQTWDHEIIHGILGELVFGGPSPTCHAAARRRADPNAPWHPGWPVEEAMNLSLAAHINAWCRGRKVKWP